MKIKEILDRKQLFTIYQNKNLFIEAGAGAGKTKFISDKTADLILQGVKVDEIVLITFTKKAAEEMLSRISKDLANKINECKDDKIKTQLITAKNNLYRLNVSTIHSFCYKLLNENSFLAKIPYNFTLIEEDEEALRRDEYFNNWYKTLSEEDLDNIDKLVFSKRRKEDIHDKYIDLCKYFPNQKVDDSVPSDDEYYRYVLNINDIYHLLMQYKTSLSSKYNKQANTFIDEYENFVSIEKELSKETIKECLATPGKIERLKKLIKVYNNKIGLNSITSKDPINMNKDAERFNESFKIYQGIKDSKDRMDTYKFKYINRYAKEAFEYYNKNCDKDKLSNNQLIYYTYRLLSDDSSNKVKEKLANKYNSIFVDEFQDTDKYQIKFIDELVKAIVERKKNKGINNTTLVVVGDPKQSIYRFRGADINSFIMYRDDTSINKEVIRLPDNFRSNNYIVDYLNITYSDKNKVFHPKYDYNNMLYSSNNKIDKNKTNLIKENDRVLAGVYSYIFDYQTYVDKQNKKKPKEEQSKVEIKEVVDNKFVRLVKFIKYLVDHKYKIYKSVNKELKLLEVNYSDFLILTHSKSEINEYIKTFNKYEINVNVSGEYNLTSSILFNLVYSLLAFIFDPNDNNLLDVKAKLNNSNKESVSSYLNTLISSTKAMTPYGKLMYVLNTLSNHSFIIKDFIKSDISTYDTVIHQVIEQININNDVDSIHLLNELNKLRETPSEEQLNITNSNEYVRVMNMHKSKGLEGNIVIVPDSGSSVTKAESILFNETVYISANNFSKAIKDRYKDEEKEELLRLEYVVASRAKSVLIFERFFDKGSHIFSSDDYSFDQKTLEPFQLKKSRLPSEEEIEEYFANSSLNEDKYYEISSNKEYKLENYNSIITPTINSFSPSDLENKDIVVNNTGRTINRPKNNIFGDCLHKGMELLINDYSIDIDKLSTQVVNSYLEDIPTKEVNNYINYLSKCIKAIKFLYDKDSIIKDYEVYPEYKFCAFINEENALVNGSIDLLLIKDNHIKIIDYKSDISGFTDNKSFEEILTNRYKPQLDFYKKIINNLFPSYSVDISIIYIEEDNDNEIGHIVKL